MNVLPERTAMRREQLRKSVRRAIRAAGFIPTGVLVEELTSVVTIQCEETRKRLAELVRLVKGRGVVTDAHLERLAWILETHWVDVHGDVQIDEENAP